LKARIARRRPGIADDLAWLLAAQEARRVDAVQADVRQRAAAGQRALQAPVLRVAHVLRVHRDEFLQRPQLLFPDHLDQRAVHRLVLAAVGDHQLLAGLAAGVDHLLAFGHAVGHRLFAQHVLAGARGADRVRRVHAVRQRDVDALHLRHAGQLVVVLVVEHRALRDVVLVRDLQRLGAVAADQRHRLRVLALGKSRQHLVDGDPPRPTMAMPTRSFIGSAGGSVFSGFSVLASMRRETDLVLLVGGGLHRRRGQGREGAHIAQEVPAQRLALHHRMALMSKMTKTIASSHAILNTSASLTSGSEQTGVRAPDFAERAAELKTESSKNRSSDPEF
jgi:hypothetical protein